MLAERSVGDLVAACRRGDPDGWEEALKRYGRLIWSVALRSGAKGDQAEEVFQRTWAALVESIHELKQPERLASWIASTTRHHALRLFAEEDRQRRICSIEDTPDSTEPEAPVDTEGDLLNLEQGAALHQALDLLDPRCQNLLRLLFFAEPPLDYQEVAARTGMAVGSIGPIRSRCLKKLKKKFEACIKTGVNLTHKRET